MEEHVMKEENLKAYEQSLLEEEKSPATCRKYLGDLQRFCATLDASGTVTKEIVIRYKQTLLCRYAETTVNGILASLNGFFRRMGWYDCTIKSLKVQKEAFRSKKKELTKKEYYRLLEAAKSQKNKRLYLLMQTICSTRIRISELPFITVESLESGYARVRMKGKSRTVLLPAPLRRQLRLYSKERNINRGSIFITASGHPMDRSNIFREMKALSETACVDATKIFPHNLRHLFACCYYEIEKDIDHLADLLGHSNINTTRIYLARSSEEQAQKLESLGLVI
ncbi:MAG: tyrosine-type recombinase/integrase [Fusicatenibacter sp.]|nr:tyrosine-type recombinase/integrase [Fusicatenibacter sp.]